MANIQPSLKQWSTTEASNQPDNSDPNSIVGDLRAIQAGVRQIYSQDTIASATTTDLGSKEAGSLTVSGTTTITGLGTVSAGIRKNVVFSGALTLTHNATSLILPTGANITTAAGDTAEFESLGSGNWRCVRYMPAVGYAKVGANGDITSLTAIQQIAFPSTQVPSTNANTLDDYEEGTWTPTGTDFSSSGGITYTGVYTKIGRVVHFTVLVDATNLTSTAGLSRITNMPFTATGTNSAALAVSAANATGSAIKTLGDALLTVTTSFASTTRITITGTYFAS